jgi:hypothetical protein
MVLTDDEAIAKKINSAVFPGLQGGPLMHVIAAKAVAFGEALRPEFRSYARAVIANAKALAGRLQERGADLVAGGTDTHLALVDLRPIGITGKDADEALERARSPATRTASRSIRCRRSRPAASASARPPAPRAASACRIPRHRRHDRRRAGGPARQRARREWRGRSTGEAPRPRLCARFPIYGGALIALPHSARMKRAR